MMEKREGHGEDSNPLSIVKDNFYAVGVFDGMGGSGAAICKSEFGNDHTKAYVASRIIQEAISCYIETAKNIKNINSDGIKSTAIGRLEQEKSHYPTKASGLRSKLVRDYPTTLAITTALKDDEDRYIINSYWAGDSRNYLWTVDGFYQISKDDLDTELDPLENLRNDAALSNCICADRDFVINNKQITVAGKFVILSATDGCYNYLATPMHFQEILLTGLKLSENLNDWENFCRDEFSEVTGDDVSLSLIAVGFEDFNEFKDTFNPSTIESVDKIKSTQEEIKRLLSQIETAKESLENLIQSEWDEYKKSYMKYLFTEESLDDFTDVVSEANHNSNSDEANEEGSKENDNSITSEDEIRKMKTSDDMIEDISEYSTSDTSSCEKVVDDDEKNNEGIKTESKDETPKFGRLAAKSSTSGGFRSSYSKPSKNDVDKMIDKFEKNPSKDTAKVLLELLDFGESIIYIIPQKIRCELKKFSK